MWAFVVSPGENCTTAQPRSEDANTSRSAHICSSPTGDLGEQEEWNYGALGTALAPHCCVEVQGTRDACVYHLLRRKEKNAIRRNFKSFPKQNNLAYFNELNENF